MSGPILLTGVFLVIVAATLIVRIGAIMLMMTGLGEQRAIFQALSAFTNTGFTTSEAELITHNPHRRKIAMVLMILGYSSFAMGIAGLFGSFVQTRIIHLPFYLIALVILILLFYWMATRKKWIKGLDRIIESWLIRREKLQKDELEDLWPFDEEFGIMAVKIHGASSLIGKTPAELKLADRNIDLLTIRRKAAFIHFPPETETFQEGDAVIICGERHEARDTFSA